MANVAGLAGFVSELRSVRTNLANELRHVDAALSVLGKFGGGRNSTKPAHTMSAAARVFEPHSVSCVESLTFIRDGIIWH